MIRLFTNILVVLMVIGALSAAWWLYDRDQTQDNRIDDVRQALKTLTFEAEVRMAYDQAYTEERRYPQYIELSWFGGNVPTNELAGASYPWIDVAPKGDTSLHPPDPVLDDDRQAGFWYNPTTGVFRARVPRQMTDIQTLELYNAVNKESLAALPLPRNERFARANEPQADKDEPSTTTTADVRHPPVESPVADEPSAPIIVDDPPSPAADSPPFVSLDEADEPVEVVEEPTRRPSLRND